MTAPDLHHPTATTVPLDIPTCILKVISRKIFKVMAFKLGMNVDLYMGYTHGHFHDLDLDARSQWLSRGTNSAFAYLDN